MLCRWAYACACVALAVPGSSALDNGWRVPQMGYNSWYDTGMDVSDSVMRATADAMIASGLARAGYQFVNIDDGWSVGRDNSGTITVDPKLWPQGMAGFLAYVHSKGMLGGLYGDRGNQTCGGRVGQYGHEAQDAQTFASWGVDYFKEDSCGASQDRQTAYAEYATMRDALNATGRPIFFSLCGWEAWYAPVGRALGNSWRIGQDDTNWNGILANIDAMAPLWPFAGSGGVNDPCLLLGDDANGNPAVTELQSRAQFSMWAVLMAPLLLSQNVRNLSALRLETYLNTEVITVNQDELHRQGMRLAGGPLSLGERYVGDSIPITLQLCGSTPVSSQQWVWNVSAPGYLSNVGSSLCMNLDDCATDIIAYDCVTNGGTCCGSDCYENLQWVLQPDGTLRSPLFPGQCVTAAGLQEPVSVTPCAGLPTQQWSYSPTTKTLSTMGGQCLQVGGNTGPLTNVWGRPLKDGSWALVFLNADSKPQNVTCDYASCLGATGMDANTVVRVRDLWAHTDLGTQTLGTGLRVTSLSPDGGVWMVRITPLWNSTQIAPRSTVNEGATTRHRLRARTGASHT